VMQVVSLSDHPGSMRRGAQQRRAAADRDAQQAHEDVLAVHRERVAQARVARDEAWAARRWARGCAASSPCAGHSGRFRPPACR
jgi:hypothetical protein